MTNADSPVAFLDGTYEEAMQLAREARAFLLGNRGAPRADGAPMERMAVSCASLKVTARLTQVIAWLLVQRAVHAGEMTRAEATEPEFRLAGQEACSAQMPVPGEPLPETLGDLMDRSLRLYERVARLDALLDGESRPFS